MKQYLLKTSGIAAMVMLLSTAGSAQDDAIEYKKDTAGDRSKDYDAIIIQRKNNKDAKITVEIKDGKVMINGKPASEYKDGNVIVRHEKNGQLDGDAFGFGEIFDGNDLASPPMPPMAASPFRKHSGALSLSGQAYSSSPRAFLGVSSERDEDKDGARIISITSGSAAEKAGLKEGDVITKIDDKKIDGHEGLSELVGEHKPGDKVTVTYLRDGKEQKATATLGKTKSLFRAYSMPRLKSFDFDMAPGAEGYNFSYGPFSKGRLGVKAQDTEDGKGVKVLEVSDESPADKAGIKEGDIITRFDGQSVTDATSLGELARASKDKPSVKVNLTRDGKPMEIEIKTPKKLKTADL